MLGRISVNTRLLAVLRLDERQKLKKKDKKNPHSNIKIMFAEFAGLAAKCGILRTFQTLMLLWFIRVDFY